jgi:hypothetical protein
MYILEAKRVGEKQERSGELNKENDGVSGKGKKKK